MSNLIAAIKSKLKSAKISATAAARSVDLSLPSFRAVLRGKSKPNARSIKKYSKLLGLSDKAAVAMIGAVETKGKRGRPANSGRSEKRGPGRPSKRGPGRPRGRPAGSKSGGVAAVVTLLKQSEAVLADSLAMTVHGLKGSQRSMVAAIVKSLS